MRAKVKKIIILLVDKSLIALKVFVDFFQELQLLSLASQLHHHVNEYVWPVNQVLFHRKMTRGTRLKKSANRSENTT